MQSKNFLVVIRKNVIGQLWIWHGWYST